MVPRQHRPIAQGEVQAKGVVDNLTTPSSSFPARALWRHVVQLLVIGVPLLLLFLFVLYPLAAIILQSVFPHLYTTPPSLVPGLDALSQVTGNPENYTALFNSLWLSGATALLASLLGTVLAILARRTDLPLRHVMDTLVWVVFFTPSFLIGEAWSLIIIRGGIPDQYLHFDDCRTCHTGQRLDSDR